MRRRGYLTAAFVSNAFTSSAFGLQRGFAEFHDRFDDPDRLRSLTGSLYWRAMLRLGIWSGNDFDAELRIDEILPEQVRWIERHAGEPFFLFLHYMEPHYLYEPPPEHRLRADGSAIPIFRELDPVLEGRFALPEERLADLDALYDGEIAYLDARLAELFAALERAGLREKTLLIITSDHGESLGEHGLWTHGDSLVEEQIRVPLILRLPGVIPAGVVVKNGLASHVDLAPTILELSGAHPNHEPGWLSKARASARSGTLGWRSPRRDRAVYAEIRRTSLAQPESGWAGEQHVRTADAKFVQEPTIQAVLILPSIRRESTSSPASRLARQMSPGALKERTRPRRAPRFDTGRPRATILRARRLPPPPGVTPGGRACCGAGP